MRLSQSHLKWHESTYLIVPAAKPPHMKAVGTSTFLFRKRFLIPIFFLRSSFCSTMEGRGVIAFNLKYVCNVLTFVGIFLTFKHSRCIRKTFKKSFGSFLAKKCAFYQINRQ